MEIPVGGKKGKGLYFQIDDADFPLVGKHGWSLKVSGGIKLYLRAMVNSKHITLHRFLLNAPSDKHVDHINGDCLDNRRSNLRLCNRFENNQNANRRKDNTSGVKGVHWNKKNKNWAVRIQVYNKRIYLGGFKDLETAKIAYNQACIKHHGSFAKPNS